jgi:hypothetical protein
LFGEVRGVPLVLGVPAGLGFVAAGVSMLGRSAWWPIWAIGAGVVGLILMVVWFNPWLALGLVITVAVPAAGVWALSAS